MRKQNIFVVVVLVLALSLALIGPAGATDLPGFRVDCTGAYGYGWLPGDVDLYTWWMYIKDPAIPGGDAIRQGEIRTYGIDTPFDVVVEWDFFVPTPGQTSVTWFITAWPNSNEQLISQGYDHPNCFQGCTPGFWKQDHHFDSWVGYTPSDDFGEIFYGTPNGMTLLQALEAKGPGSELLRHSVAALLNAANDDVDYALDLGALLAAFAAGDAATLVYNNELYCTLD